MTDPRTREAPGAERGCYHPREKVVNEVTPQLES
jgi:hypothetical protein